MRQILSAPFSQAPGFVLHRHFLLSYRRCPFVTLVGICVTVALYRHRNKTERRQRFLDACAKFRAGFAPTLGGVESGNPEQFASRTQEDTAIAEFRLYLHYWQRTGFDAACEHYRECRKRAYPAPDAFGQVKTFPRNKEVRDEFAGALKRLLAYANETYSSSRSR